MIDSEPPPSDIEEATRQAVDDLAARLDVDPEQIEVSSAGAVTWSDGSLGCPEPGKMYTQSLVPGFRVILTVDGTDHAYHAAEGRELFYCNSPSETPTRDT